MQPIDPEAAVERAFQQGIAGVAHLVPPPLRPEIRNFLSDAVWTHAGMRELAGLPALTDPRRPALLEREDPTGLWNKLERDPREAILSAAIISRFIERLGPGYGLYLLLAAFKGANRARAEAPTWQKEELPFEHLLWARIYERVCTKIPIAGADPIVEEAFANARQRECDALARLAWNIEDGTTLEEALDRSAGSLIVEFALLFAEWGSFFAGKPPFWEERARSTKGARGSGEGTQGPDMAAEADAECEGPPSEQHRRWPAEPPGD